MFIGSNRFLDAFLAIFSENLGLSKNKKSKIPVFKANFGQILSLEVVNVFSQLKLTQNYFLFELQIFLEASKKCKKRDSTKID